MKTRRPLLFLAGLALSAVPAHAAVESRICGTPVAPKNELAPFADAGVVTHVWRDAVTACGASLSVMHWQQKDHWFVSIERVVADPFAPRRQPVQLKAALLVDGKPTGTIDGPLYEFQISLMESAPLRAMAWPDALRKNRLVPPIAMVSGQQKPEYLTRSHWSVKAYTSLRGGPLERGMPNTGERPDIGLVHEWCAMWLNYPSDYWWQACQDAAKDSANIPWHVSWQGMPNLFTAPEMRRAGFDTRDEAARQVSLPSAPHDLLAVDKPTGTKWVYAGDKTVWTLDHAHQPFAQLVPYMATRHPLFLYLAQYQAGVQFGGLNTPPLYGGRMLSPLPTVLLDQDRALAWSLRTLSQVVLMTPDKTPGWLYDKAQLNKLLAASITRWTGPWAAKSAYWQSLRAGSAKSGNVPVDNYIVKATGKASFAAQAWEVDYLGESLGFARWAGVDAVEPLYAKTRDILVARYAPGSPYRALGAPRTVIFSDPKSGVMAKSMGDVVRFTPSQNLAYGTNAPLKVGNMDEIGQWTEFGWQVQGTLALCAANGDTRCDAPLAWWNRQAAKLGTYDFDKYRIQTQP